MQTRHIMLIAVLITLGACGAKQEAKGERYAANAPAADAVPAAAPAADASAPEPKLAAQSRMAQKVASADKSPAAKSAQLSSSATTYVDGERKFIRTADVRFLVKDVYQSALSIEDITASFGGFVTHNDISSTIQRTQRYPEREGYVVDLAEYTTQGQIEVHVPSQKTQDFLRALVSQIVYLDQRNFNARDVQFDLLRQQLEAQRNEEAQLDLQLATKEGGKLEQKTDAIEARSQAKQDRDEARVARKELEDQIAFSTITLSIYQAPQVRKTEVADVDALFAQNRPGFGTRLWAAMHNGVRNLEETILWCADIWPLWLFVLLVILATRKVKMWRRQRRSVAAQSA